MKFLLLSLLASAANAAPQPAVVYTALKAEPPQLDSTKAADMQSYFVIGHTQEGLVTTGPKGELVPGVAERWKVDENGGTFHLRRNARWSDGKPVTAHDFVFAWRRVADPATASEYAFILYPLKNGEAVNRGKAPLESLGVKALDDYTLKVELERPCPYFLGLTAMGVYCPLREDFVRARGARYAAEAADLLANGPFLLKEWVHGARIVLERNPTYWNAGRVKLDRIEVPYITADNLATYNFFRNGKIDLVERMERDHLPLAQADGYAVRSFAEGRVMYLEFNFRDGRPTANAHLRRAIRLVTNPSELVQKVVSVPGTRPATSLFPSTAKGVKGRFNDEYPIPAAAPDLAKAKAEVALAAKELGGRIPVLHWLVTDEDAYTREAEYFQQLLKSRLGLEVRIDRQIPKQKYAMMSAGQFDIVSTGWGADYDDPMTFADLKASWSEANRGRYASAEYDRLIRVAMATGKPKARMDAMAAAQKIALADVAFIPLYQRVQTYLVSPRVQGLVRNPIGLDPDFRYARITR
jgi:oligopeptide transport system substrate-binding protein